MENSFSFFFSSRRRHTRWNCDWSSDVCSSDLRRRRFGRRRLRVIHPTAIVSAEAAVDPTAEIGPYVVIEGPVRVGAGTRLMPHVVIRGATALGARNVIHPGVVLGGEPQDLAFCDGETFLTI